MNKDAGTIVNLIQTTHLYCVSHVTKRDYRLSTAVIAIALTCMLSACGTKYANPPADGVTGQSAGTTTARQDPLLAEPTPAPTSVSPDIKPTSIPSQETPRSLPAAIALRDQAAAAAANNNHTRAIGLLERAIRISPQDPLTFAALAESHLAQSRPQQALELTRRALLLNPQQDQLLALEKLEQRCLALL